MTPIIALNLDRSKDRQKLLEDQFKKAGITDFYFFPGFDGNHITNMTLNVNIGMGYGSGRPFQKAELGIIMSHIAAWKFARIMGWDNVIILEDDVAICEDWSERLNHLHANLQDDWEYVYLSGHSDYVSFPKHENPVIMQAPQMVGAFSYMINSKALSKMEKYCSSFMTTLDDMIMNMVMERRIKGYIYFPFMTYHNAQTSLIWGKTAKEHSSKIFFRNKI